MTDTDRFTDRIQTPSKHGRISSMFHLVTSTAGLNDRPDPKSKNNALFDNARRAKQARKVERLFDPVMSGTYRTTERDKRPPKSVVPMGERPANRPMADAFGIVTTGELNGRWEREHMVPKIILTFKEYREIYNEPVSIEA